jgi:hypothetical protein
MRNPGVVLSGELIDREESLFSIEGEVTGVVVGKVPGVREVANDEKLDEAEERTCVAVAGIILVFNDLLHRPAGADAERFQLDLDGRDTVDQQ